VADEGKQRDFQTKPDNRPLEEKLLHVMFSVDTKGVSDSQRIKALNKFNEIMKSSGLAESLGFK
jgi:hypothetical protein